MRFYELFEENDPGIYVAAKFSDETNNKLTELQRKYSIPNPVPAHEFHCTIVYSTKNIPFEINPELEISVDLKDASWELFGNCLVLHFQSDYCLHRFETAMDMGATYDFDDYKAHVTLSYEVPEDFKLNSLKIPDFKLEIIGEYTEELKKEE